MEQLTTEQINQIANKLIGTSELAYRTVKSMLGTEYLLEDLEDRLETEGKVFFCEDCYKWKPVDKKVKGYDCLCTDCE